MFKKPIDPYEDLDKKDLEKKYDDFSKDNDFSKEDENAMIIAALKILLPVVLAVCALFAIFILLMSKIFLG